MTEEDNCDGLYRLRVTTRTGCTVEVTHNHPMWNFKKGWVQAGTLQVGDRINIAQPGVPWDVVTSVRPWAR